MPAMDEPHTSEPAHWEPLTHTSLAKTRIFDLRSHRYRHPRRHTERDFIVIDAPDWVNVVALTPDGKLVLVRQFRFGINRLSLEIPGGVIEMGEAPLVAGVRELEEETGYTGAPARLLGSVNPNPAIQNNRCHFVLVEQAVRTAELGWDEDEELQVATLRVEEVLTMAHTGGITHGLVLNALMFFEPVWRATGKD